MTKTARLTLATVANNGAEFGVSLGVTARYPFGPIAA